MSRYSSPVLSPTLLALAVMVSPPSSAREPGALEEVVVTAHHREYRLDSAEAALGLNLKLLETPAAVSVITEDLLKDQQVNNVDDALRNVAGVTKFKTGNGGEEKFSIRGFDASQSIYKDGARINNPLNASNIPSTETANIERIEVLKGPSALLYGQGEPGGIINYITKRPEIERGAGVELMYGSDSFKKVEFDATGGIGASETFAARIVGAYQDSDSFRDEVFRERLLLNPSLAWLPDRKTRVVLGYEYIDDEYTQDRGQVLQGNAVDGYSYGNLLDVDQFFGIPDWNRGTTAESSRVYLVASRQVVDGWRVEFDFNYTENQKTNVDSSPSFIGPNLTVVGAPGTEVANQVAIQPRKTEGEGETIRYNLKNEIEFSDGFGFAHRALVSFSYEDFSTESTSFRGDRNVHYDVVSGGYFTPDMGPASPGTEEVRIGDDIIFGLTNRGDSTNQDFDEYGINLLDYVAFDEHWAWLIGGRYSQYQDKLNDFDDDNLSLRTGLVYTLQPNLSFYLSYSEGYTNSAGRLGEGGDPIDAETSAAWELGGKWQLFDDQLLLTATLYDVEKQDVAYVANPNAPENEQYFGNIGTVASSGLELEAVGYITERWRVQAGYAYIDSEITDGGIGDFGSVFPEGNALPGIAEHNFNAFTFYELPLGPGFIGMGGGLYYQDEVYISTENRGTYDSWTQVDLAAYYKQGRWKLQFNASNITDEDYRLAQALTTSDSFAAVRVGTSAPRGYVASLAYEL